MDEKSFSSIDWSSIRYYISQNKLQNFQRHEKKAENLLSSNDAYKSIWVNEYKIDKSNMKQDIWSKEKHKTRHFDKVSAKGQLISKCPFGNLFQDFCPSL